MRSQKQAHSLLAFAICIVSYITMIVEYSQYVNNKWQWIFVHNVKPQRPMYGEMSKNTAL